MEQQTIFFKEISKLNLFDLKSENRIDLAKNFRLKLVANSNKFGIVAFGFNNVIKIYNTNEFESVSDNQVPNHIATVNLEQGNKFVHIEFNSTQTHLIALVINFKKEKNFEYFLNVYAMESIKVDVYNSQQSPVLLNRIALENDNSRINDLLVSPKDDDLVILSKENGKIEIISKILDRNYKINSKQLNSLCICWSPTGKNFAYCSKDKRLSLNSLDFEMKYEYQCLENDLEPNSIKWLTKKEFLVSYTDAENNPRIFYHEIIKNQNANETFSKEELDGAVFATGEQNDISWINFKNINENNLILCAYSKCPEIGVLVKDKNSKYQLLFLEEFRPNLPMSSNENDVFPIGIEISFNSQKEIDFDTRGKQPPSPLLFCLADTGFLSTFYVINKTLPDKKVCKAAEKLPYTQIKASLLPTPEPNISVSQKDSILSPINSKAPFRFKQNEQKTTDPTVRTFKITSESKENVPSQSINLLSKASLINQQQAPNNLPNFEKSKQNLPSQTIQLPDPCICKHAIRVKINKKNGEIINRTTILKSLISLDTELTESIDTVTTIWKNIWFVSFKESFDYKVLIGKCLPINEHIVSIENAEEPLKNEKIFAFKFYGLKPNFDKYLIEKHLISEGVLPMEIVNIYDEFMSDAEFRHIKTGTVRANLKFNSAQNPNYYEIVTKIPKDAYIQGHPVSIERVGEPRCRFCQSTEHKVVQCKFKCIKCNGRGHTAPECNLARRIAESNNDHQFDDDEGLEISVVDEIDPEINKNTTRSYDLSNKNDKNTQMMANVDTNDEEVNYQSRQLEKIFSTKPSNLSSQFKSNIGLDTEKKSEKKENFGIQQSRDIKQQDTKEKDLEVTESFDSKSAETDKKNKLNGLSTAIPSYYSRPFQLFKTSTASFSVEKKNEPTILSKPKEQTLASSDVNVKSSELVNMEKKSSTSKINFGSDQLAGQDLANSGINFATGDSKSATENLFDSGFTNKSGSMFGAKTESKPANQSTFFSTKPANLPSQFKSNIGLDTDKQSEKKENFGIEQSKDIKQQDAKEKDLEVTESFDSKSAETDKKNKLNGLSTAIPSFQSENLTKSDIKRDKKEDKKKATNLFGLFQGNKPPVFDMPSFSTSPSSQFSFNLNQAKGLTALLSGTGNSRCVRKNYVRRQIYFRKD